MKSGSLRKDGIDIIPCSGVVNPLLINSQVKDVMDRDYCHFDDTTCVAQAMVILLEKKLTGAPVLDERGCLSGFLSLKDCLPFAHLLASPVEDVAAKLSIAHLMSHETHFLTPEMNLDDALKAFLNQWFHVYPVVDETKRVVGVISRRNLLSYLCR